MDTFIWELHRAVLAASGLMAVRFTHKVRTLSAANLNNGFVADEVLHYGNILILAMTVEVWPGKSSGYSKLLRRQVACKLET